MYEKYLLLQRSIEHDVAAIGRLYDELGDQPPSSGMDRDLLIAQAYRLHNLYNAFENIFQNIARAFENALDDAAGWHAQLLQRMRLDLMPVRPMVIDQAAYDALDELRRFRHVFRYAYDAELDPARLRLVWAKAMQLRSLYVEQIDTFLIFVRGLSDAGEGRS